MASSDQIFNVGIVGYGMSAKIFHIPFINLTKQFSLHTIVQRSPTPESSAPKDHPSVKHHTSLEPLLVDPDVHIVNILTPPNTHFDFAKKCLEAGKHVLVEKPFVPSVAEADELIRIAREKKRLICVYQNRRWDSDFLTLQKMLKNGTLGRVYEFDTHFDRYRPVRPETWKGQLAAKQGGGVLYDLGTHLIDQAYVLFGLPETVYAKFTNQRVGKVDSEDPDSVFVQLGYSDGLIISVRSSVMSVESPQRRYWVRGTKASYHKYGLDPQEDQLKAGKGPSSPGFGVEDPVSGGKLFVARDDGTVEEKTKPTTDPETYTKLFEGWAKAVASGKEEDVPVPATEARDVLRILEAAQESAKTGREVRFS